MNAGTGDSSHSELEVADFIADHHSLRAGAAFKAVLALTVALAFANAAGTFA
jgi:hypothetical protein